MAYPGGSDLGLEDSVGAQFSLVWGAEHTAEIAVNDGYEGRWSSFNADRDQLLHIAAHILVNLSLTGETVDKIIVGLEPIIDPDPRTTDCCAAHRLGRNLDFKCLS